MWKRQLLDSDISTPSTVITTMIWAMNLCFSASSFKLRISLVSWFHRSAYLRTFTMAIMPRALRQWNAE